MFSRISRFSHQFVSRSNTPKIVLNKFQRNTRFLSNVAKSDKNRMITTAVVIGILVASIPVVQELTSSGSNPNENKEVGSNYMKTYLENNKDAVMTPSGLIFHELSAGKGPKPTADSTVTVHYTGSLTTGVVFDSSITRGQPISFPLKNVIAGWTEGVAMMKTGGKARLVIPSKLGYGDKGAGSTIPGGSTLIFEIELLAIETPGAGKFNVQL